MIVKVTRIVAVLLLSLVCVCQGASTEFLPEDTILFAEKTPKKVECRMFYPECTINVLIDKKLPISQLSINSTDWEIFTYKSIENCETDCSLEPFAYLNRTNLLDTHVFYQVKIVPGLIGGANLTFLRNTTGQELASNELIVNQPKRIVDRVFDVWIWVFGTLVSSLMGVLIDRESLLKIIRMPKAVAIGFCCQYIFMPLLAFGVARLFHLTPLEALALFIYGCSPGGVGSNNWTILFEGDIDLSAILTFVSTCSSIIMMPTWVYTLGTVFSREAHISIPIFGLVANLFVTIGPCLFGLVLCYFFPKLKQFALRIAKPFTLVVLLSFLILLLTTKAYTFKLVRVRHWTSGPLIPYFGYILGGSAAFLMRLTPKQIKTVALETGIQNVGVAFLIIYTNLPSPLADYAAFPIIAIAFMTPAPLYTIYFISRCVVCARNRKGAKNKSSSSKQKTKNNTQPEKEEKAAIDGPEQTPMIEKQPPFQEP